MKTPLPSPRRRSCKGFTLVEVLVVIAILVVLAALVIGLSSRVQRKARSMQCMGNLREWALIFQNCAADRNGRLPTPKNWAAISHTPYNPDPEADNPGRSPFVDYWSEDLEEAFRLQLEHRACPCLKEGTAASGNRAPTYMMNSRLSSRESGYLHFLPYMVNRPADKVLFIDGNLGCPLQIQSKDDVDDWIAPAAKYHGGTVNAIFADLHVGSIKPEELKDRWKEMINPER